MYKIYKFTCTCSLQRCIRSKSHTSLRSELHVKRPNMTKNVFLLLAILFALLSICFSRPSPWYRSEPSAETKKKADENYQNDPLQHWVCSHFGDDSPKMRDDLNKRKDNGEHLQRFQLRRTTLECLVEFRKLRKGQRQKFE